MVQEVIRRGAVLQGYQLVREEIHDLIEERNETEDFIQEEKESIRRKKA